MNSIDSTIQNNFGIFRNVVFVSICMNECHSYVQTDGLDKCDEKFWF